MADLPTGTVTFLFTDIENSSPHWEKHPNEMKAALARHDAILRQAIEDNHGYYVKTTGDGVHAVFTTSQDGLQAAVQAQCNLQATRFFADPEISLRVRMGVHTGEAELRDGDYYGQSLNRAARIMSIGHGGQILISAITRDLLWENLPEGQSLTDLGEHHLKGLLHPEHIYQVEVNGLQKDFPALNSAHAVMHNLPTQLTSFIGRQRERAEVDEKLKTARMLTLIGPGGTGKTRLSLQVAEDQLAAYKDGVWFVELAPLADARLVLQGIASIFNIREVPGVPLQEIMIDFLRAKSLLLILDNCEHLVEACAKFADQALRVCPQLKMMVSSREALGISGETVYRVPSLGLPDLARAGMEQVLNCESAQLFLARARAANPRFELTDKNYQAVAQICMRLDGIPLALELAAARVTLFSAEQIAARLDDRFKLLTGGSRTALPRQQTLRALIDWSYDMLSEDERSLLRALSVFAGGWSFEAAEAVCPELDVLSLLGQLVNKSLVTVDEGASTRYKLLETIRQYARDKLLDMGESERVRNAHLDYFVTLAEKVGLNIEAPGYFKLYLLLEPEYDNFRAAIEWALHANVESSLRLISELALYWYIGGHITEGIEMTMTVLASVEQLSKASDKKQARLRKSLLAKAYEGLAFLTSGHGDTARAIKASQKSIALAREIGDTHRLANGLSFSGTATLFSGDIAGAARMVDEALSIGRSTNDRSALELALGIKSQLVIIRDHDMEASRRLEEEGEKLKSEFGPTWASSMLNFNTGRGAMYMGEYAVARERFLKCLPMIEQMNDVLRVNLIHSEFAHIDRFSGRYAEAEAGYRKTILIWQRLGHRAAVAHQLECFGMIAIVQGRNERAVRLLGAAESLREQINIHMTPPEHEEYEKQVAKLRAVFKDEEVFASTWAAGRAMTMEQAIQLATDH